MALATEETLREISTALGGADGPTADHDAALPDGVSVIGGVGKDTAPTSVTDGETTRAWFSRAGAVRNEPTVMSPADDTANGVYAVGILDPPPSGYISPATEATAAAMSAKLPASLGVKAAAASLSVTQSTEDAAKTPALGQALAAASVPVVLTAIQVAALGQDATLLTIANGGSAVSLDPGFGTVTAKFSKASAGTVQGFTATNANAAIRYFQLHNKATIPLATEVPLISLAVPALGSLTVEFPGPGHTFGTGIGWAWSTTVGTFTDAATANEHTNAVAYR
jgi:hypothetical protein